MMRESITLHRHLTPNFFSLKTRKCERAQHNTKSLATDAFAYLRTRHFQVQAAVLVGNRNDIFVVAGSVGFGNFFDPVGLGVGGVLLLRAEEGAAGHVHVNDTLFRRAFHVFLELEPLDHEVPEVHHFLVLAPGLLLGAARPRAAFLLLFALFRLRGRLRRLVGVRRWRLVRRGLRPRV